MEIRRIEGIYLQHALETSQGLRAENLSRQLNLRLLSTVPESIFEAFSEGGNPLRGYVLESYGKDLRLLLNNSQEILAENMSTLDIQKGDYLELVLASKNPINLKITLLQRRTDVDQILDMVMKPSEDFPLNIEKEDLGNMIKNSGIFYERKLLSYILGNASLDEVLEDTKAQIIQNISDLVEEAQSQLNVRSQTGPSLDSIKHMFLSILNKTEGVIEIRSLLKSLYLENLNNWEFDQLVRFIESAGNKEILRAMERGDRSALVQLLHKEIESLLDTPAGRSLSVAFERLKAMALSLEDVEVKEQLDRFVKALNDGKLEDLKDSHNKLVSILEDREKLLSLREKIEREGFEWLNRLNLILQMQKAMVNNGVLVIPFRWDGRRSGMLLKPGKEDYRVFINLNYPEGFLSTMLSCPKLKETKSINLNFYTNSEFFHDKIRANKHILENMLREEGFRVREFRLNFVHTFEDLKVIVKQNFQDTNLYLVV